LQLDYAARWSELYVSRAASDGAAIVASISGAMSALINDWHSGISPISTTATNPQSRPFGRAIFLLEVIHRLELPTIDPAS
jgi:hypothetical protein